MPVLGSSRRIPTTIPTDVRYALEQIWDILDRLVLADEIDMTGRHFINCGDADEDDGLVTLAQLRREIQDIRE